MPYTLKLADNMIDCPTCWQEFMESIVHRLNKPYRTNTAVINRYLKSYKATYAESCSQDYCENNCDEDAHYAVPGIVVFQDEKYYAMFMLKWS